MPSRSGTIAPITSANTRLPASSRAAARGVVWSSSSSSSNPSSRSSSASVARGRVELFVTKRREWPWRRSRATASTAPGIGSPETWRTPSTSSRMQAIAGILPDTTASARRSGSGRPRYRLLMSAGHAHDHGHGHGGLHLHAAANSSLRSLTIALVLNAAYTLVEVDRRAPRGQPLAARRRRPQPVRRGRAERRGRSGPARAAALDAEPELRVQAGRDPGRARQRRLADRDRDHRVRRRRPAVRRSARRSRRLADRRREHRPAGQRDRRRRRLPPRRATTSTSGPPTCTSSATRSARSASS